MSSSKEYLEYVLELLSDIEGITYRQMMGEYLLYYNGTLFGGIYDDRFLIKKNSSLDEYGLSEEIPYEGAKPMYLVDTEEKDVLRELIFRAAKKK